MKSSLFALLLVWSVSAMGDLSELSFLSGHWQSSDFGKGATESWTSGDTSIAGMFNGILDNGMVITEFMLIQKTEGGAVLRWNHFNEDYSRWESKPIEHHLVESGENFANFEMKSEEKGLPRNLIYRRTGDQLNVWVGDNQAKDQTGAFELTFTRVGPE